MKGLRVGIPKEYRVEGAPSEIDALWAKGAEWLKAQGAEIVEVSLPHTKYALAAYYIVAPAEASSNLARYDGVRYGHRTEHADDLIELYEKSRAEGFGREVRRRIMIGTYVLSAGYYDAYYLRAQRGAQPDRARLHRRLQALRHAARAGHAVHRLRARREDRRSGLDVSHRRVHGVRSISQGCRASRCRPGSQATDCRSDFR